MSAKMQAYNKRKNVVYMHQRTVCGFVQLLCAQHAGGMTK